jgi:Ankyrin repeats (3 copies)/Ankyrin repeat
VGAHHVDCRCDYEHSFDANNPYGPISVLRFHGNWLAIFILCTAKHSYRVSCFADIGTWLCSLDVLFYLANAADTIRVGAQTPRKENASHVRTDSLDMLKIKPRNAILAVLISGVVALFGYREYQSTNDYYLLAAAATGDLHEVKRLIGRGAQINAKFGGEGETALHRAVSYGRLEVVDYLISNGADVNAGNEEGWTPLISASYSGNMEIIQRLVSNGANVNAQESRHGFTPLTTAVLKGRPEAVEFLLNAGADTRIPSTDGVTPLERAKMGGNVQIVTMLETATVKK